MHGPEVDTERVFHLDKDVELKIQLAGYFGDKTNYAYISISHKKCDFSIGAIDSDVLKKQIKGILEYLEKNR